MLLHRPILSAVDLGIVRSAGPGLGNLLLPIARAILAAERLGGVLVQPTLRQVKLGPILRRERDKRMYGNVLRHRSASEMHLWMRSALVPQVTEGETVPAGDVAIRYAGMQSYFHDLVKGEASVRTWLETRARGQVPAGATCDIAVHVRLGDFAPPGCGNANSRIGLAWYADAIEQARRLIAIHRPKVKIFTDGLAEELAPLLGDHDAVVVTGGDALTAIRIIARARILVASRSTFSMWGAFLGEIPAIWDKEFDREIFFPQRGGLDQVL